MKFNINNYYKTIDFLINIPKSIRTMHPYGSYVYTVAFTIWQTIVNLSNLLQAQRMHSHLYLD